MSDFEQKAQKLEAMLDLFPSQLKHPLTITFSLSGGMIDPSTGDKTGFTFVYDPKTKILTGTGFSPDGPIEGVDKAEGPLKAARMVFDFMWDLTQLALEGIAGSMFAPPMMSGFAVSRVKMLDAEYSTTKGEDLLKQQEPGTN